jgi:GT2 family glycosyltransferase
MPRNLPTPAPHNPLEGAQPELTINLHDGSEEQVSIVIVHKDRPEYLNICLQSIAVTSLNNNYEIIVVDNASGQDSQDFLNEIEGEVKVIRNSKNEWWSKACNIGAKAADKNSKYLIFMHCDVVVLNPAWIDLLINVSESQESGLVGVDMGSYYMQNQKVDFIQDWCCMMTRECWKEAGPFPEDLPMVGGAFVLTMKGQQKGFRPQIIKNQIVHHYRIFSLDFSQWERFTESAMTQIPKLMREVQTQSTSLAFSGTK